MTGQVKSIHPTLEPYNLFTIKCNMKASTEQQAEELGNTILNYAF